jgi:hypothetical protein
VPLQRWADAPQVQCAGTGQALIVAAVARTPHLVLCAALGPECSMWTAAPLRPATCCHRPTPVAAHPAAVARDIPPRHCLATVLEGLPCRAKACRSTSCQLQRLLPCCHRAVRCHGWSPAPFIHKSQWPFHRFTAGLLSHTALCCAATGQGLHSSGLLPQLRGRGHQEGGEGGDPGASLPEPCCLQDVDPPPRHLCTHELVGKDNLSVQPHMSPRS